MNKKIPTTIAISIVLILAILAGGFIYWRYSIFQQELSNQPDMAFPEKPIDETADWQTYINEDFGIEFEYPSDWAVGQPPNSNNYLVIALKSLIEELNEVEWAVGGSLYWGSIYKYAEKPEIESIEYSQVIGERTITVDNIPAIEYTELQTVDLPGAPRDLVTISVVVQNGEVFYEIGFPDNQYRNIFDQMLSTFKFIENDETANWDLNNAEYRIVEYDQPTVKLENGYYFKQYPDSASGLEVSIYKNKIAFGDLNSDGKKDAAVILDTNGGGSGFFRELAIMLNEGGKPIYLTSVALGDRVIINSIDIELGIITLDMIVQGPGDAFCCPTLKQINKFKLSGNQLVEI